MKYVFGGRAGRAGRGEGREKLRSLKLGVDEKLIKGGVDSGINVRLILVRLTSWDTVLLVSVFNIVFVLIL